MKRLLGLLLALLVAGQAIAEPNGTCNFKSGTPTCIAFSGYVFNLGTQSTQRLNFLTNNTVRGYIDGTTGVWTGLTLGATSMGELTLSGALKIPNATAISALNQAGDTYIPLLLLNTNNTTLLQSGVGEEMQIRIGADANRRFDFSAASDTAHVLKFGDDGGTALQHLLIAASTADADDDSVIIVAGGGANGLSRGGSITLAGNEASGLAAAGSVVINGGNNTLGDIGFVLNNAGGTVDVFNSSTAKMWTWDNSNAQLFTQTTSAITSASADAADSGFLYVGGGGGGASTADTRGAYIGMAGNENGGVGSMSLVAGNVAGGNIHFFTNGANTLSINRSSNVDITFNKVTAYLRHATSDAADTGRVVITGGGNVLDTARGAYLQLDGNEAGGAGVVTLYSGNVATSDVAIGASDDIIFEAIGGTDTLVLDVATQAATFTGAVTSSATGALGWAVVDGTDNTACTSQCTSAAVFGFNLAAGATAPVIVGPSDATADICMCAGAS